MYEVKDFGNGAEYLCPIRIAQFFQTGRAQFVSFQ